MRRGFVRDAVFDNRGVALVLVVSVVSLLVALTLQFNRDMRQELTGSVNMLAASRLNVIATSGYNIARATLLADEQKSDSYFDIWAELDASSLEAFYDARSLDLQITDLSGRIPLNNLGVKGKREATAAVLKRLLLSGNFGDLDADGAELIVNAITDWVDADNESSSNFEETESGYYQSLDPPYACKNAPLEFVEELLLIRGIGSEIYFGAEGGAGLREFVTVQGQDVGININTAPKEVLMALMDEGVGEDLRDELATNMVTFRTEEENSDMLQESSWYETYVDVSGQAPLKKDLVTVQSSYFRILSRAELDGIVKDMYSVVKRESGKITLIYKKVE